MPPAGALRDPLAFASPGGDFGVAGGVLFAAGGGVAPVPAEAPGTCGGPGIRAGPWFSLSRAGAGAGAPSELGGPGGAPSKLGDSAELRGSSPPEDTALVRSPSPRAAVASALASSS